jgi:nucleotide-binding universal stress UspA family protein
MGAVPQIRKILFTTDLSKQTADAFRYAVDLVVMGYHPRGRIEEALTGSVTKSVLRKVEVPVLLVRLS